MDAGGSRGAKPDGRSTGTGSSAAQIPIRGTHSVFSVGNIGGSCACVDPGSPKTERRNGFSV